VNSNTILRFDRDDKTVGVNVDSPSYLVNFARWLKSTNVALPVAEAIALDLFQLYLGIKERVIRYLVILLFGYIQNYSIKIFAVAGGTTTVTFTSSGKVTNTA
jgi:hypothetical protein